MGCGIRGCGVLDLGVCCLICGVDFLIYIEHVLGCETFAGKGTNSFPI